MKLKVAMSMVVAMGIAAGAALAADVSSVNVVGYQSLTIQGTGGSVGYQGLAIPFSKIPAARGVATANNSTTITDGSATWTPSQFKQGTAAEAAGLSTFYVEISDTNSAFEGRHWYIADNSGTVLTLVGAMTGVPDNALANTGYKIVAGTRVRDIFGVTNVALKAGSGSAVADTFSVWSTSQGGWGLPIFYRTGGFGSTYLINHWALSSNVADDVVIDRDDGFLVKRQASGATTNITVAGEVSMNAQSTVLVLGYNLLGGQNVVDRPIVQAGLTNVMKAGSGSAVADTIAEWSTGSSGWSLPVFYRTGGFGSTYLINHWAQGSNIVDDTFIIKAGNSYLFKMATNKVWTSKSPLE